MKTIMVNAICKEIEIRQHYLKNRDIESLYFGGGTPTLLTINQLSKIINSVHQNFRIASNAEITLEANPDDLTPQYLKKLRQIGINRLSIGIQSFHEPHLKYMNRAHSGHQADVCVKMAQDQGFENISIDLIYGIPFANHSIWMADLEKALNLNIPHISSYCLTIESKTTFGNWVKTKKMKPIDENFASEQFEILMNLMAKNDFEQYEISNFAKKGCYSKHNSSYWLGKPYLGVGPSAHSFDGESRQYNIANNSLYIKGMKCGQINFQKEVLTKKDKTNEYLMTSLRTIWGTEIEKLEQLSEGMFLKNNETILKKYLNNNWIENQNSTLFLTKEGKFFADLIASNLFID